MTEAGRVIFARIAQTRQLDYCSACEPGKAAEPNMIHVLALRRGRWFTCACGTQWRYGFRHGVRSRVPARAAEGAQQ